MSDVFTGQILAAIVLLGTLAGGIAFVRSVSKNRARNAVRARRKPAAWAEAVWPIGTIAIQVWAVGVLVAPAWFYAWPGPLPLPWDHALQFAGIAVWAVGGFLVIWAGRTLGRFMVPEIRFEESHRLVREGPYRSIRHPTYTADVTMAVGLGLAFLHPALWAFALLLALTARHRALLEEDLLRSPEAFGTEYDAYMTRTGRFLPKFRGRMER